MIFCSGSAQKVLRLAKTWVEEQLRLSDDGASVGYDVYQEDAQFIKKLLEGETAVNGSPCTVRTGRLEMDVHEALATPRRFAGASAANGRGSSKERPTRPWADG